MGWKRTKDAGETKDKPRQPLHIQIASGAMQYGRNAAQTLAPVASVVGPFGVQFLVSSLAYSTGLAVFQCIGGCLRISCNSRILGPGFGCIAVGASSAFTGQVSRHTKKHLDSGADLRSALYSLSHVMDDLKLSDALIDAVLGVAVFKVLGGELRRVLPSDLRQPGAYAFNSVPVTSGEHTSPAQKAQLVAFFKRDGCHHCGVKHGNVIGDHIPPTKLVKDASAAAKASAGALQGLLTKAAQTLRLSEPLDKQHYFAQCGRCCKAQANLLRHPAKVSGFRLPPPWPRHLVSHALSQKIWPQHTPRTGPGVLIGFRQYLTAAGVRASGTPRGGGRGGRHSKGGFAGIETGVGSGNSSAASSVARQSCVGRFWAPDGPGRALAAAALAHNGALGGGNNNGGSSHGPQELFSLSQRLGEEDEAGYFACSEGRSPVNARGSASGAAADYVFIHGEEGSGSNHPLGGGNGGNAVHGNVSVDPSLQPLMQQPRGSPIRGGGNGGSSGMQQQQLAAGRQGPARQLFAQPQLAAVAAAGSPPAGPVVQGYPAVPGMGYSHAH